MNISNEIRESFKKGSTLTKLIYLNLAIFVLVKIFTTVLWLMGYSEEGKELVLNYLAVPASFQNLIVRPWTVLSYMFLHMTFLHILFNLLWLFWFGQVFMNYLNGKKLAGLYLLGGLFGAVFYIGAYNLFPVFEPVLQMSTAIGASASVMAVAIAISVYVPDYKFNLIFIGPVKIIYIAFFFILTDILTLADGNAGGHIAHLGGAFIGYIFALQHKKGKDITKGINSLLDGIVTLFKPKPRINVSYRKTEKTNIPKNDMDYNRLQKVKQEEVDRILDKIATSGYESLTKKEKEILFNAGKN